MKNLPFVVWMLGFPLFSSVSDYLTFLQGKIYSDTVEAIMTLISLIIWGFVGYKLYEPHKNEE